MFLIKILKVVQSRTCIQQAIFCTSYMYGVGTYSIVTSIYFILTHKPYKRTTTRSLKLYIHILLKVKLCRMVNYGLWFMLICLFCRFSPSPHPLELTNKWNFIGEFKGETGISYTLDLPNKDWLWEVIIAEPHNQIILVMALISLSLLSLFTGVIRK